MFDCRADAVRLTSSSRSSCNSKLLRRADKWCILWVTRCQTRVELPIYSESSIKVENSVHLSAHKASSSPKSSISTLRGGVPHQQLPQLSPQGRHIPLGNPTPQAYLELELVFSKILGHQTATCTPSTTLPRLCHSFTQQGAEYNQVITIKVPQGPRPDTGPTTKT